MAQSTLSPLQVGLTLGTPSLLINPVYVFGTKKSPGWQDSNFTIIDTDDQIRLIKNICKAENIDVKQLAPRYVIAIIDKWKNKGLYPNEVKINSKDIYEKTILPVYKIYQQKLIELNACDFGDLILHSVKILEKNNQHVDEILSILKSNGFTITLFPEFWNKNNSQNQTLKSDYILGEKSS